MYVISKGIKLKTGVQIYRKPPFLLELIPDANGGSFLKFHFADNKQRKMAIIISATEMKHLPSYVAMMEMEMEKRYNK